jgi:hypothetical protein
VEFIEEQVAHPLQGWIGLQANGSYRVTSIDRAPLYGSLLALALLLGLASLMWWREGR